MLVARDLSVERGPIVSTPFPTFEQCPNLSMFFSLDVSPKGHTTEKILALAAAHYVCRIEGPRVMSSSSG